MLDGAPGVVVIHPDDRMTAELFELRSLRPSRLAVFGTWFSKDLESWARERADPASRRGSRRSRCRR
jgi:hypothetical protein